MRKLKDTSGQPRCFQTYTSPRAIYPPHELEGSTSLSKWGLMASPVHDISRTNTAKGRVERRWQDNFKVKQKGCFFYSNARIRFVSTWSNPRRTLPSTFRRAKQATSALNTDARIYLNVLFLGFLLGLALVRIPLIPLVFPLRGLDQVCR
jgi:hypothetical protein